MSELLILICIIFGGGAILTFARRFNNPDKRAGLGIAAWTIILIIILLMNQDDKDKRESKLKELKHNDSVKIEMIKLRVDNKN